jgi:hypothetical protein
VLHLSGSGTYRLVIVLLSFVCGCYSYTLQSSCFLNPTFIYVCRERKIFLFLRQYRYSVKKL